MDAAAASASRLGWKARAAILAAALWWGSVTAVGFMVVPMLFANLPTPAMAGTMAGKLFSVESWVAVGCGLVLLFASKAEEEGAGLDWRGGALLFVVSGMLVALLTEFGVAPRILARENLKLWHTIGSAMYVLHWLCAFVVLWKVTGRVESQQPGAITRGMEGNLE
jgi:hypothetical protein